MISVHIADDHTMMVELLIPVINASGIAAVTASSGRLSECRKSLAQTHPDVLLLDVNMPDGDGIDFCGEIHKIYPKMKIIALTGHDEYSSVLRMMKNGASGYVVKSEAVSEILEAILSVMQGETYISQQIENVVRKTIKRSISLTPREKQVLQLVAKGLTNAQIAEQLRVELSTVHSYRKKLNLKFDASNVVELIAEARKKGYLMN